MRGSDSRWLVFVVAGTILVFAGAGLTAYSWSQREDGRGDPAEVATEVDVGGGETGTGGVESGSEPESRTETSDERPAAELPVRVVFKNPPRAGLLFDVDSGDVLWQLNPLRRLPIASLNKMMTGLLIAERHRPRERVAITPTAAGFPGSGIGLLRAGTTPSLRSLLAGLMLVSGNDAAVALAEHDAGSTGDFVARMNERARKMDLDCTRFTTPHGLEDKGNYSCPRDLAALARADLANPWLRRLASTDHVRMQFPVKGGHLELANNNPFVQLEMPGVTGLKTGYTDPAGRCYVTTARRRGRHLGVVLLHTPDPLKQVPRLLKAGFRATRTNLTR